MKILRVISSMHPENGGPCQGIRNSIPAQEFLGVESDVLCFDAPSAPFLAKENLKIHAIGPAQGPYSYCSRLSSWLKINLLSFDVVIIHGLWLYNSYGTYKVWRYFKNKGFRVPKLYVMPHGMLDPYFQKARNRRFKALRNWAFWKLIEHRVINGADGVLFTCEQELLLAREAFTPYKPKAEIDIGYGIQFPPGHDIKFTQSFMRKCPGIKDRPYFLFLSRIHPKKGVDLLISAYLKLKKEYKTIPDLVIAGPGLDTIFGKAIQEMAINQPIYFPGMLEGDIKWGAFYGCEAFILPSHQENFGIAVVEAMACAKPVLISNQVNIWREIEKANAGLICEDTEAGVLAMLKYWTKEAEENKKTMGIRASKVFKTHYAIDKAAARMIACVQ